MKSGSGEDPFEDLDSDDDVDEDVGDSSEETGGETGTEEWVRIQFRVPEAMRTELNDIGYAQLRLELNDRGIEGKQKRELQRAAVRTLLDNPGLWADTVAELDDDE